MFSSPTTGGAGQVSIMRPPGYHFLPNDEELVLFLQNKVRGDGDGPAAVVEEIDIYGDRNPWELFDKDVKKDYYVFTKLRKKGRGASRFDRTAGSGTWKERQTKDQDKNNVHWTRKDFLFVPEKKKTEEPSDENCGYGHWIMHEYSLNSDGHETNDYVICKIKNKHATQEDYGPGGQEGIERFLAQIRLLNPQLVKNENDVVSSGNKRKLHLEEEDGQQQQVQKKSRTSNDYSHQNPIGTSQFAEQEIHQQSSNSSNSYNLGCGGIGDSKNTFLSVDHHVTTWVNSCAIVRTESCCVKDSSRDNSFAEELIRSGNANFFSAASTMDPFAATPMDNLKIFPYLEDVCAEEDQFCVSYAELFADTPELNYFSDLKSSDNTM